MRHNKLNNKPYDIFVSYATEDEEYANQVAESLRYYGLQNWFAPLTIQIGESVLGSINNGLRASEYGLVIVSRAYMDKSWTKYELDVLYRQHIEKEKIIFPLWHGVDKKQVCDWHLGLAGIKALNSTDKTSSIANKIVKAISKNAPIRGVTPDWENPHWRFLQGRGELLANNIDGGVFNIFEAADFSEGDFPLYICNTLYSKEDIVTEVAKVLLYNCYNKLSLPSGLKDRLVKTCKSYGFDVEDPNLDPATIISKSDTF